MRSRIISTLLLLSSLLLSLLLINWAAENVFFDKLFYKKSILHGYWVPGAQLNNESFGLRGRDMATLFSQKNKYEVNITTEERTVLGASVQKEAYTIVVIGDSYVWGEGIRNEARFVKVLEDTLNTIRPTHIISLGNSGDNILENYLKYTISLRVFPDADLYVFALVNNDLLYSQRFRYYDGGTGEGVVKSCDGVPIFEPSPSEIHIDRQTFSRRVAEATTEPGFNWCMFQKILQLLPHSNAIYFTPDVFLYPTWEDINKIMNEFERAGLSVIPSREQGKRSIGGSQEMNYEKFDRRMFVSDKEIHPSDFANKIFAKVLFEEIMRNPKWKFTK